MKTNFVISQRCGYLGDIVEPKKDECIDPLPYYVHYSEQEKKADLGKKNISANDVEPMLPIIWDD